MNQGFRARFSKRCCNANIGIYKFGGIKEEVAPHRKVQQNPYCLIPKRRPLHFPIVTLQQLDSFDYSNYKEVGNLLKMENSYSDFLSQVGDYPTNNSNETKVCI